MTNRLEFEVDRRTTSALVYRAHDSPLHATLVLAHGAGVGQSSPFIVGFATALAARGLDVVTFNFLYTEMRRRAPDRTDRLEACFRGAIDRARRVDSLAANAIFIGGKSMGGRIASHLAASGEDASGVIALGYPLHPPGKPDQLRTAHFGKIRMPMLIVQGSRDPFGAPDELRRHLGEIAAPVTLHVVEGGDHSLAPPKRGGTWVDQAYGAVQDTIAAWIGQVLRDADQR